MSGPTGGVKPARLVELVEKISTVSLVVLADLVLDEFRYGEPDRVSREAPVLILSHRKTDLLPGGGAYAVANLKALGARPVPLGRVGDDASGTALLKSFAHRGIPSSHVWTPDRYKTPTKTRILAGGAHSVKQQVVRIDVGEPAAMTAGEEKHLRETLPRAAAGCSGLLISDYGYGMLHPGNIPEILAFAKEEGIKVIVDSRAQLPLYRDVTAAAPNLEEAVKASGVVVGEHSGQLEQAGKKLRDSLGAQAVLITLGSRGMALFTAEGASHLPVYGTDEVADVTGAGDTVAAAFSGALLAGGSFLEASALANVAAGLVVMKRGTATVSPAELTHALGSLE